MDGVKEYSMREGLRIETARDVLAIAYFNAGHYDSLAECIEHAAKAMVKVVHATDSANAAVEAMAKLAREL